MKGLRAHWMAARELRGADALSAGAAFVAKPVDFEALGPVIRDREPLA